MRCRFLVVLVFGLLAQPANACRQALILGLDVSASVDRKEYELQRRGLAHALIDPQVMDLIIGPPGAQIELMIFEWSGAAYQSRIVNWTTIDSQGTLLDIATTLSNMERAIAPHTTAIGAAMLFAADRFDERSHCQLRTLDLSGDGRNNGGSRPQAVKPAIAAAGIVVNGLVIGLDQGTLQPRTDNIAELTAYYHANVIVGPYAFIETAIGYEDYGDAIKRKLIRETVPAFAALQRPAKHRPL